jgi:hypothetical protein
MLGEIMGLDIGERKADSETGFITGTQASLDASFKFFSKRWI